MTESVLIIGATRGLGASLAVKYAKAGVTVYGTSRSEPKDTLDDKIVWISGIDVGEEDAGSKLAKSLAGNKVSTLIITAGYFFLESFDSPSFAEQLTMYKTSAIGPVFIVQALVKAGIVTSGGKIILVSSESGSIALRHEKEGGGAYGHHASKAALNMVGKLLSLDLKDKEIAVGLVHPGFMRTGMTKGVGFDKYWEDGGAVHPDEAADSLIDFIESFGMHQTGEYWAPRGPADIGTAEPVLGPVDKLPTPLQLPWTVIDETSHASK